MEHSAAPNAKKHQQTALLFFVHAAVLLFCILFLSPSPINNDDSIISGILGGAYGSPSVVTAHTNILFAALIVFLNGLVPAVNFFAVFEVLLLWLAFFALSLVILQKNRGTFGRIVLGTLFLFVAPEFYTRLHNTKLAPLLAAVGVLLLLYGVENRAKGFLIIGALLALFSSFFRLHAFLLGALLPLGSLFLLLPDLFGKAAKKKKEAWQTVTALLLLFLVILSAAGLDHLLVSRIPGGSAYRDYNKARGMVSDFPLPDYFAHEEALTALGVSELDYALIDEWNFGDLTAFPEETLLSIAALREQKSLSASFFDALRSFEALSGRPLALFALIAAAVCFFFADKRGRWTIALALLFSLLALFFFSWIGRTTHWVTDSLAGALIVAAFFSAKEGALQKPPNQKGTAALLFALSGLFCSALLISAQWQKDAVNIAAGNVYRVLREEKAENLYLFDHGTAPAAEMHRIHPPFAGYPRGCFQNSYSLGGWDTGSPAKNEILHRYGVGDAPYSALLIHPHVFLIDKKNPEEKLQFLRERIDPDATMSLIETVEGFFVYAFCSPLAGEIMESEIRVTEAVVSTDELLPNGVYVGVSADRIPANSAAYLRLLLADGTTKDYRARLIEKQEGAAIVMSVSVFDLPPGGIEAVTVVFQTTKGLSASEQSHLTG